MRQAAPLPCKGTAMNTQSKRAVNSMNGCVMAVIIIL
jgi:hypothetical protein